MRIIYTHDIFSRQKVGGISRYYVELIRHLAEGPTEIQVHARTHANEHLRELQGHSSVSGQYRPGGSRLPLFHQLRNRFQQANHAKLTPPHVAHHTYYSFTRPLRPARLVVTVHDLIPERFPRQFGWKGRLLAAAKSQTCALADRILVISKTTKNDLVENLRISPERIDVTYLGNSLSRFADDDAPSPYPSPYILYVGARGGYKNCKTFWEAYAHSSRLKNIFHVLCFGGGGFSTHEHRLLEDLNIAHLVKQTAGDDRLLASCYRHASVFVYPSLYEGFGIPPVEAMSFGCLIVASTGGSIPEVVGPAAIYFDPLDGELLTETLERVLFDESIQNQLRAEMKLRESRFRWEETARQTLACYERAVA